MENQIITASKYDEILLNLIPRLSEFKSYSGADGTAYIIDDKFVVKKISKARGQAEYFDKIFESYYHEMNDYADKGYNVPRFYSWAKIKKDENSMEDFFSMPYIYYVLQERMPGRQIYLGDCLENLYDCFEHICSADEYKKAFVEQIKYESLIKEIVEAYVQDFVNINSRLEAMSDSELEKFVFAIYDMLKNGKYNVPDIYKGNILLSDKDKISLIDNTCIDKMNQTYDGKYLTPDEFLTVVLFELLNENAIMQENMYVMNYRRLFNPDLKQLIRENEKLNEAVLIRIVDILKKCCGKVPIKDKCVYEELRYKIICQIGLDKVNDFMDNSGIERAF